MWVRCPTLSGGDRLNGVIPDPQRPPRRRRARTPQSPLGTEQSVRIAAQVPPVVRYGALIVVVQCLVMFGYAIWLIIKNFRAGESSSLESASAASDFVGIGTAVFLMVVFGFVGSLAVRTALGQPSGSGAIVLIEMILLGVAVYMFMGDAIALGAVTAVSAVIALLGIFHPAAAQYWEARYEVKKSGA